MRKENFFAVVRTSPIFFFCHEAKIAKKTKMDAGLQSMLMFILAGSQKNEYQWVVLVPFLLPVVIQLWKWIEGRWPKRQKGASIIFITRIVQDPGEVRVVPDESMPIITHNFLAGLRKEGNKLRLRKEFSKCRYNPVVETIVLLEPGNYKLKQVPVELDVFLREASSCLRTQE